MTPSRRGRLIAFEGGEGCGKSTQAAKLAADRDALLTSEPGDTEVGRRIRAIVLDPAIDHLDPRAEALLMAADRAQHVREVIEPALAAGRDVVTDRFIGSSLAYQGFGRGLDVDELRQLSHWAADGIDADLVVLLDVDPAVAHRRLPGPSDRMEAEEEAFHDRVAAGFRTLAAGEPERWVTVDGTGTVDEVAVRVKDAVAAKNRRMTTAGELYDDVVGQDRAVAQLRAAAAAPVHAYLLVGPPGSGKRAAARSFAASLLCPNGGCGTCRDCTLARAETHPDAVFIERVGPYIDVKQAARIVQLASLSPVEGRRKVLVPVDFHLVREAAPKLLKTIEEPPESTVFVVLAEDVPPELVTIASRCVRIDFRPVGTDVLVDALVRDGVDRDRAVEVAAVSGGRLDRARLLASDPGFLARRDVWRGVPARLDGSGAAVALVTAELVELIGAAAVEPLEARHVEEVAALEERIRRAGERGSGRKELEERHKRELRRLRTDELRFGLATLQAAYRDEVAAGAPPSRCVDAVTAIDAAARELTRNPNETLMLQALLLRLSSPRAA